MKYLLTLLIAVALTSITFGQKRVKLEDVANHVGDTVLLEGKVYGVRYLSESKGAPTLLNMGAAYPNQLLTLVIWGENRKNFDPAPEVKYADNTVWVTGKVELYKGKPQIVLTSEAQIGNIVVEAAPGK